MALIKLSSVGITNISGKAGGTIYSHNQGGAYAKNFAVPVNPQTQAQQFVRSMFGSLASVWRTLTQAQREAWTRAAGSFPYKNPFGDVIELSGIALHQSLNRNIQVVGSIRVSDPPVPEGVDAISELTPTISVTAGVATVNVGGDFIFNEFASTSYAVYATPPLSQGINSAKNRMRLITSLNESAFESGTDITAEYEASFGVPEVGGKVIFRVDPINRNTGERGASFFATAISTEVIP